MTHYLEVTTTVASQAVAERIALALVEARLAACVQVAGPLSSTYRWQGCIEQSTEYQCRAKTREDLYTQLEALIRQMHEYDVPEILAVSVVAGHRHYLEWLEQQLIPPMR